MALSLEAPQTKSFLYVKQALSGLHADPPAVPRSLVMYSPTYTHSGSNGSGVAWLVSTHSHMAGALPAPHHPDL